MQSAMAEGVWNTTGRPIAHQPRRLDLQTRRTGILSWPSDRHPTIRILSTRDQPEPSDRHQTAAGETLPRFNLSRIRLIQRLQTSYSLFYSWLLITKSMAQGSSSTRRCPDSSAPPPLAVDSPE